MDPVRDLARAERFLAQAGEEGFEPHGVEFEKVGHREAGGARS